MDKVSYPTGFTLIELVVVIAVIVIVSVVVYANYNEISDRGEILGVSEKLRQNIRLAQNFSITGKANKSKLAQGWGVYLNRQTNQYTVFSDLDGSKTYNYPTVLLLHGSEAATGGVVKDSSFYGNNLTLNGPPTRSSNGGKPDFSDNGYWNFTGGQYLDAGSCSPYLPVAQDFTIDLWFKISTLGSERPLINCNNSFDFYVDSVSNKLVFTFHRDTGGMTTTTQSIAGLSYNTWYHAAEVRNGNYLMLFLNGQMQALNDITGWQMLDSGTANLYIGHRYSPSTNFDGSLDEIRITKGWANWFENFTPPTAVYGSDEEKFLDSKLPPGVVFQDLRQNGTAQNPDINLFFSPVDHYLYVNGIVASSTITINRGGMADTGLPGDTPRSFLVGNSGLISLITP